MTNIKDIVQILEKFDGENISIYDAQNKNKVASFFIVCSFKSETVNKECCNSIKNFASENNLDLINIEGYNKATWIVMDLKDIIIHTIIPKERIKYNLDKLFKEFDKITI